jgi:alkylhydroperoxidase family enzyme
MAGNEPAAPTGGSSAGFATTEFPGSCRETERIDEVQVRRVLRLTNELGAAVSETTQVQASLWLASNSRGLCCDVCEAVARQRASELGRDPRVGEGPPLAGPMALPAGPPPEGR